jgi:acetyl/propionyl-CoA carboxylase alpha subunit
VDSGIEAGDEIGLGYDSLIAKIVAHGRDREQALDTLATALDDTDVAGITTNLTFLRWLVSHPVVRAAEATTAFLTEHPPLSPRPLARPPAVWRAPWRLNLPAPPAAAPPDVDRESYRVGAVQGASTVVAPMPGTVIRVEVETGAYVHARSALVVLEAMKMEIPVHSPFDANVTAVHVATGDRVAGGALLVELES